MSTVPYGLGAELYRLSTYNLILRISGVAMSCIFVSPRTGSTLMGALFFNTGVTVCHNGTSSEALASGMPTTRSAVNHGLGMAGQQQGVQPAVSTRLSFFLMASVSWGPESPLLLRVGL